MTRKKIHVTAEDIAGGRKGSAGWCPIALALGREVPYNLTVGEDGQWSYLRGHRYPEWYDVALSQRAQRFIDMFDSGKPVTPFAFFTEVPDA